LILKVATESKVLQEVYTEEESVCIGARVFFRAPGGATRGGIVWGYRENPPGKYTTKSSGKTLVYKDNIPIVNHSLIETSKDLGEYYLYPSYAILVKLLPDILFKANDVFLKLKIENPDFTDKVFKRIFRLLKKRNMTLEEAYKKYKKDTIDFYINKGFLEISERFEPLVIFDDTNTNEEPYTLKKSNIKLIAGDYKKKLKEFLEGSFQSLLVVSSKHMFDTFKEVFENAVFFKSPSTPKEARMCYQSALKENKVFVTTSFGLTLPFFNLKNIVLVDDMYTEIYKSKKEPYIDFRRLSYYLSKHAGADLYTASEALSINDYYLYKEKKAELIYIEPKIPDIKIIEKKDKSFLIDKETLSIAKDHIDENILFYVNKSGYSYAYCERCNALDVCPYCESYTTYFKSIDTLRCTKCKKVNQDMLCSRCHGPLKTYGAGLEQYQEYITSVFGKKENFYFSSNTHIDDRFDIVFVFSLENLLFAPVLSAREVYHHKLWSLSLKAKKLFVLETSVKDDKALESIVNKNQFIFLEDELERRRLNQEPPFVKAISIEMDNDIDKLYKELLDEHFFYISKPKYFYEKGQRRFRLLIKIKQKANIKRLGEILKKYKNYKLHIGIECW